MPLSLPSRVEDFGSAVALRAVRNTNGRTYERYLFSGINDAVGSGAGSLISPLGAVNANFNRSKAERIRVAAGGSAADTAGGNGARRLRITGIDTNFDLVSNEIDLAGASASSYTADSFYRLFRAEVVECGIYTGINAGPITLEWEDGVDAEIIQQRHQQTLIGGFSTPRNVEALVYRVYATTDQQNRTKFTVRRRIGLDVLAAPFNPQKMLVETSYVGTGGYEILGGPPLRVPPKSDFWVQAATNTGTNQAGVVIEAIFVPQS